MDETTERSPDRIYEGQPYWRVSQRGYTRLDGSETFLVTWRSYCAECGGTFDFIRPGEQPKFQPNRRCREHIRPGVRVRKNRRRTSPATQTWPSKEISRKILAAIAEAAASGRPWSIAPKAKSEGRHAIQSITTKFRITAKRAAWMIKEWQHQGVLAIDVFNNKTNLKGLRVVGRGKAFHTMETR